VSDNLTGLWRDNGKRVPFAARRNTWRDFLVIVTSVEPRYPSDRYAKVRGHLVALGSKPVERGQDSEHEINCAGCYQWHAVPMPEPAPSR
jgi:hypothetical protein